MVFHPTRDFLYVVNEHDDSVTTYDFDTGDGTLTRLDTVTTLPMNVDGNTNTCADIHISGDGRFVYASNRGHDSIAIFSVDSATGLLTAAGHQATEARPREFEVALGGRFLYAAGQDSDALAAYAVDDNDGSLSPIMVYPVGSQPLWVTAVSVDRP